ncbi:hypothetical protein FHS82_000458 [Pseudochelatococcus lubricantis]|uniref:Uncharacterized protein n=1 Tax=Pseudochelatococcus lubricantis TaxID=1538102 RepID=A0ABX0UXM3_9HYPH|nr:hypothetical protein [Pseudochelatococcus lubricantis]NIJ56645.1 hypothetical protein [Pseudochelatococcus lubricantis]
MDSTAPIRMSASRRPGPPMLALATMVAAVTLMAMLPYLAGYRLSGDDIWFLQLAIEGSEAVADNAMHAAIEQGRVGQLLMLPLNVLGAYLSGDPVWRAVFVALYVAQLLLFAVFVSTVLQTDLRVFLFVLLVALHPLAFAFMPPNAYPLQNTVPLIAILGARIAIVRLRQRHALRAAAELPAQVVFALGMLVSEFAVAFGTALLLAEYAARAGVARQEGRGWRQALQLALARRFVHADGLAVLAAVGPYLLFRWWNPGVYDGNSAGGIAHPLKVAGTIFGHVRDGTAFPRLGGGLSSAEAWELLVAAATGVAVAAALFTAAGGLLRLAAPAATGLATLLLAAWVTLPVAISTKYQAACMDRGSCAYLDSRISYLAVTVAVACAVAFACRHPLGRATARQALAICCVLLGVMAALTSIYNAGKARDMRRIHQVWERADRLACTAAPPQEAAAIRAAVDPDGLIAITPPGSIADFWKAYFGWKALRCP